MGYRLTSEERRIIERTKREGEEFHGSETRVEKKKQTLGSALIWIGGIVLLALLAMFMVWLGSLIG
jgi:hypothetical protein